VTGVPSIAAVIAAIFEVYALKIFYNRLLFYVHGDIMKS